MINWSKTKISIARAIIEQGSGPKGPMSCRKQGGISRRPSVRPSWGGIFQLLDGRFRPLGAYLKGRCEVWRVDLRHGGGKFKAKRADLRPWGLNWGLGGLIWGLGGLISGPEGLIWGPGGMIWGPGGGGILSTNFGLELTPQTLKAESAFSWLGAHCPHFMIRPRVEWKKTLLIGYRPIVDEEKEYTLIQI